MLCWLSINNFIKSYWDLLCVMQFLSAEVITVNNRDRDPALLYKNSQNWLMQIIRVIHFLFLVLTFLCSTKDNISYFKICIYFKLIQYKLVIWNISLGKNCQFLHSRWHSCFTITLTILFPCSILLERGLLLKCQQKDIIK